MWSAFNLKILPFEDHKYMLQALSSFMDIRAAAQVPNITLANV